MCSDVVSGLISGYIGNGASVKPSNFDSPVVRDVCKAILYRAAAGQFGIFLKWAQIKV